MHTIALQRIRPNRQTMASIRTVLYNLGLISMGCVVFTIGLKSLLVPKGFLSGGIVGISLIIHYGFNAVDIGLAYFLLNIPLVFLCWFGISRKFLLYSMYGAFFFSLTAYLINVRPIEIQDPILVALLAGFICGIGGGLILMSTGSAGGFDILAVFLNRKFGFRVGPIIFLSNAAVLVVGALLFDLEKSLYSIIYIFTSTKVIDTILAGFNRRKSLLIISDQSKAIADGIMNKVNRGATLLKGEGAYTGKEKSVVFTVAPVTEIPRIKESIFQIDPKAFVVINDTMEVLGNRHGTIKKY